jgi:signal recognition particle receptor subunit beta
MSALNPLTSELMFKIVFYGPGLGGKTTTLQHIHATTKPEHRGSMVSLATETERTLYFDFLPLQVLRLRNLTVRLQLFTVPGQVYYGQTRKLVLSGCDGIVFVADSQNARFEANQESLDDLNANLLEQGRALSRVPHQFHWNKRDLPDITPTAELDRRLNLFSAPALETIATTGEGIFRGLELITKAVFHSYKAEVPAPKSGKPIFLDAEEVGLADAIRDLADSRPMGVTRSSGAGAVTTSRPLHVRDDSDPPTRELSVLAQDVAIVHESSHVHERAPLIQEAGAPTLAPATAHAFTLSDLWPEGEREAVKHAEALIGARDAASAVLACEAVLTRTLGETAQRLGDSPRDPATIALLLGVDGARYVAFVTAVRAARAQEDVTLAQALACYAVTLDAQRGLSRAR